VPGYAASIAMAVRDPKLPPPPVMMIVFERGMIDPCDERVEYLVGTESFYMDSSSCAAAGCQFPFSLIVILIFASRCPDCKGQCEPKLKGREALR
jgi:hypothetical protein